MKDIYDSYTKDIRRKILTMSYKAASAHVGGALSAVEIMTALYKGVLHHNPKRPNDPKRDRLIFSKGHDAKVLYAVLATEGYFPTKELDLYEQNGGKLPGHSTRGCVPGVEYSAGSLGHGLPMAVGVALHGKKNNKKYRVYCILSDGECDEGTTWESALFAHHYQLDNLTLIIDRNFLQGFGFTEKVISLEPLSQKWKSFGWGVETIAEGHSVSTLIKALSRSPLQKMKPTVFIVHTTKGLGGVSKHVNQISSQYKSPSKEELVTLFPDNTG